MSKTFEGVDGTRLLHIKNLGKHVAMSIEVPGQVHMGITFDPASIPALVLAELEAAGVEARHHSAYENGTPEAMEHIAQALTDEIGITEAATAEAKEQAGLAAEAFELRRAYLEGRTGFDSWGEMTDAGHDHWLAVARKAREMRVEK